MDSWSSAENINATKLVKNKNINPNLRKKIRHA